MALDPTVHAHVQNAKTSMTNGHLTMLSYVFIPVLFLFQRLVCSLAHSFVFVELHSARTLVLHLKDCHSFEQSFLPHPSLSNLVHELSPASPAQTAARYSWRVATLMSNGLSRPLSLRWSLCGYGVVWGPVLHRFPTSCHTNYRFIADPCDPSCRALPLHTAPALRPGFKETEKLSQDGSLHHHRLV